MAILSKGQTFANGDDVTSTKLNNLVDAATFVAGSSGTTDDSTLEVNGSGRLQVKDSGITTGKLGASAVTTAKLANSTATTDGVTFPKMRYLSDMTVIGNVSGGATTPSEVSILDEDDMASDSATSLATQQSIKAYIDGASSLGANGYVTLPIGLTLQWGSFSGSGSKSVTFPTAFTSACYNVQATLYNGGSEATVTFISVTSKSTTGASFFVDASNTPLGGYWFAIGV